MHPLVRHLVLFTGGMLICGSLEGLLVKLSVGATGLEGVACSVLLCLIPGWLTLYLNALIKNKDLAVYSVLFGTGLRMTFVLLGLLTVNAIRPDLGFREFTVWLIPNYLVSLGIETILLLPTSLVPAFSRTDV